jgi:PHD/YefM family antitoxin component YafN of YafNO toxin-antitoxin module
MTDPKENQGQNQDASKVQETIKLQKEEIDLLRKRLSLQEEGYSLSSSYLESLKEVLGVKTKLTAFENDIYGISKQINKSLLSQKGGYDNVKDLTKQIKSNQDLLNKSRIVEMGLTKSLGEEKTKQVYQTFGELDQLNQKSKKLEEYYQQMQKGEKVDEKILEGLTKQIEAHNKNLQIAEKSLSPLQKQLLYSKAQSKELKKQNEERKDEEKYLNKVKETTGVIGALMAGMKEIPFLKDLPGVSTALEDVRKEIIRIKVEEGRTVGKTEAMGIAFKNIGSSIKENLLDPTVLVSAAVGLIVKGFLSLNEAQTNFARETGRTASRWDATSTSVTTLSDYIKTATDLTKQLGFQADLIFTSKTLQEATEMVELMGMSSEEAGKLAMLSKLNGTELKKANESVIKTAGNFNKTNRTAISQKQILSDVANTSNVIAVNLGGNASKIAQANLEARRFGLSLEKADQIASSLLDFESSISAEIEAELLTGKDLNLEKARLLALNGETAELTKEIGQNQDIISAYTSGNRLQQEAVAKSVGLQREDIAKMIIDQKAQLGLTDEQVQKASGMNEEDFKRLSVQESINKSMSKMGEALAGPLEMLASMVAGITQFSGIITAVIGSFVIFKGIQLSILGIQKISAAYEAIKTFNAGRQLALSGAYNASAAARQVILQGELAKSIGIAAAWAIANPYAALAGLAIAAGVGLVVYSQMKDGVIDPKKGPIVSGEFGTVQLNPNDQIVAGTDLAGTKKPKGGGSQPSIDITPMIQELQAVKSVLNQILIKDNTIKMDSNKVGQAHNIGAVKVQ